MLGVSRSRLACRRTSMTSCPTWTWSPPSSPPASSSSTATVCQSIHTYTHTHTHTVYTHTHIHTYTHKHTQGSRGCWVYPRARMCTKPPSASPTVLLRVRDLKPKPLLLFIPKTLNHSCYLNPKPLLFFLLLVLTTATTPTIIIVVHGVEQR